MNQSVNSRYNCESESECASESESEVKQCSYDKMVLLSIEYGSQEVGEVCSAGLC